MKKGPGLFSDFGKKAKDLLNKDYTSDQKFTISSSSYTGLALVSNIVNKGGLSSGDVAAQYKHQNAVVDFKLDTVKYLDNPHHHRFTSICKNSGFF